MVEWDSGGMRDSNRFLFPREIGEREKHTCMRQTREMIQDARELATSRGLKIMGRRPITPTALSVGGGRYLFYILMRSKTHIMCC